MPNKFIELEDLMDEAAASWQSRISFQADLFRALRQGTIAAQAVESVRVAIESKWFASVEAAAETFGFSERIKSGIRHATTTPGYHTLPTKIGYITFYQQVNGLELFCAAGEEFKSYEVDIKPSHWDWAEYDGHKVFYIDQSDNYRMIFKGVTVSRIDFMKSGILPKTSQKKRSGPKGAFREEIVAKALALIEQQPDVTKTFFDMSVRGWLEEEGLSPAASTYHEHYGRLLTRHMQNR